jgi:redox-sensitive bicupin YhaK (pirin superfamily)
MSTRRIVLTTKGNAHGFIRRMVSPSDLGEAMKPFIFLDHVGGHIKPGTGFGFHPHSGIATLTYHLDADVRYEDTAGQKGWVKATGLEWMRAGGGTWHQGFIHPTANPTTGFQLWVALPPGIEDGPAHGTYLPPELVPQVGDVRVLLGTYAGATNPIETPSSMTYLDVSLRPGVAWTLTPEDGHDVAWAYVYQGHATVNDRPVEGDLVVFEEGSGALEFLSMGGARALVGTAKKHPHPLVLGSHSVHTNAASLARGGARIAAIGAQLTAEGRR